MNYWILPGIEFSANQQRSDLIIRTVCQAYEKVTNKIVTVKDVKGRSRLGGIVDCRSISAYLLESAFNSGCTQIGKILNRDHASVLHYWGRTKDFMQTDIITAEVLSESKKALAPYNINWKPVRFGSRKIQ